MKTAIPPEKKYTDFDFFCHLENSGFIPISVITANKIAKTGRDMKGSRESSAWEYINGDNAFLGYGSVALLG